MRYAVWFGLLSGFGESAVRLLRQVIVGVPLHLGMYVLWMPAVIDGAIFLLLGAILALLARFLPRALPDRALLLLFSCLALFNLFWVMSPPLHLWAVVLLAFGAGLQLSRLLWPRLEAFERLVRRTLPATLALPVLLAGGIEASRKLHERRTLSLAPAADPTRRPNVLLLVLDTVRSMNLSLYGYFRPTSPEMIRLAARGVRFDDAVSTAPWTLPSHASIFTGRWVHEQSTGWKNPLDGTWPTLAEALNREGYATAGFISNYAYCDREYGLDRGFSHYEDYLLTWQQVVVSSKLGRWFARLKPVYLLLGVPNDLNRKTAGDLREAFLDWSADHTDRPWFGFINFIDAHWEYWWPREMNGLYRADASLAPPRPTHVKPIDEVTGDMSPQPIEDYDRAITYIDREIRGLLAELERRGQLENTLVILTSDHGEEFWEHGMIGHGNGLYHVTSAVPLIVSYPGTVPAGRTVSAPVSLRNIPATILSLSGAASPAPFPGIPLQRYWEAMDAGGALPADTILTELTYVWDRPAWYPASRGNMRSFYDASLHLIRNGDGIPELYDRTTDPWEQAPVDLAAPQSRAVDTLRARLERVPEPIAAKRMRGKARLLGKQPKTPPPPKP